MARRRKISRSKKLIKVLRRKWFKPGLATLFVAFLIYFSISNMVIQINVVKPQAPHFLISRVSDTFEPTEFSHLLLTVQEINKIPGAGEQLKEFVNTPHFSSCPESLTEKLNYMNWEPHAFWSRVQKLFSMYEIYDRVQRLDQTINFLTGEIGENRLPLNLRSQVKVLKKERNKILKTQLTDEEYQFIDDYQGIIIRLREN